MNKQVTNFYGITWGLSEGNDMRLFSGIVRANSPDLAINEFCKEIGAAPENCLAWPISNEGPTQLLVKFGD